MIKTFLSLKKSKYVLQVTVLFFLQSLKAFCEPEQPQVPPVMYDFLGEIMRLQPFFVSEKAYLDPKNEKEISAHLKNLKDISTRLSHNKRLSTSSFQVSTEAIKTHLSAVYDTFKKNQKKQKQFSRRMLIASLDGCGSCHAQVPNSKINAWQFKDSEIKGSSFEKAEFLFAVRHYDEALTHYNEVTSNPTPKNVGTLQLETALRRKLVIFVRVKQSPKEGIETFQTDIRNKNWPSSLKTEVAGWIDALKKISPSKDPSSSAEVLEAFASTSLPPLLTAAARSKPGSYVTFLYVSGRIYQFINTHPESELTPGLLYWLAISDIQLNRNFFFNLADSYLKECINRFPQSATAKKCYSELETTTLDSFTGSRGVYLPEEVNQELQKYKAMLK